MIYKNYISCKNLSGLDIYISLFFCFFVFVFLLAFIITVGHFFLFFLLLVVFSFFVNYGDLLMQNEIFVFSFFVLFIF